MSDSLVNILSSDLSEWLTNLSADFFVEANFEIIKQRSNLCYEVLEKLLPLLQQKNELSNLAPELSPAKDHASSITEDTSTKLQQLCYLSVRFLILSTDICVPTELLRKLLQVCSHPTLSQFHLFLAFSTNSRDHQRSDPKQSCLRLPSFSLHSQKYASLSHTTV